MGVSGWQCYVNGWLTDKYLPILFSSQSDDIILTALKSFNGDPEMYYIVVETVWELLKLGQDKLKHDKR